MIRFAVPSDVPAMHAVEHAAGEAFRTIGMDVVADDDSPDEAVLLGYVTAGPAWVSTFKTATDDSVVGHLLAELLDGALQIEQVSVDPRYAGRRRGSALIDHAAAWAGEQGLQSITLTTFTDVPWNAPYYERLGFRRIPEAELPPGLARQLLHENEYFGYRWPRTAMRRKI